MGSITSKLFGGPDKGLKNKVGDNKEEAQREATDLFQAGEINRQAGTNKALDILGSVIPQQFDAFQSGNVEAQKRANIGMHQANNAILGNALGGPQFEALRFNTDTGFANQQLPDFVSIGGARDAAARSEIATDADLLRVASEGRIGDFGSGDRKFFANLAKAQQGALSGSTNLIDDPEAFIASLRSEDDFKDVEASARPAGLLTGENVGRLTSLLRQYGSK